MVPDFSPSLSLGVAAAALLVAAIHVLYDVLRVGLRGLPRHRAVARRRSAPAADGINPAADGDGGSSERADAPAAAAGASSPAPDANMVPAAPGGGSHNARPDDDKARRIIAYGLVALLALYVVAPLVLVAFKIIAVEQVKEFDVTLGQLVTLVMAAVTFYFAARKR